ncbi:MAG: hypothetical protein JL50_11305 [Peptococcaceae bacterium BICA1-7]|nr:MAG: hypothetical protein JL50_11305 [Peptococcaceae bacterium BICA1-7]
MVLGDSLTLPRAVENISVEDAWPWLLEKYLSNGDSECILFHRGLGGASLDVLWEHYQQIRFYIKPSPGSIAVLQYGIVDCAPRPLPFWARKLLGHLHPAILKHIVNIIHRHRSSLLGKGISFQRTSDYLIQYLTTQLLEQITSDYHHVFVVGIMPADEAFDQASPGVRDSVTRTNKIIKSAADNYANAQFLDMDAVFGGQPEVDGYISRIDHHHLTKLGHKVLARTLYQKIFIKRNLGKNNANRAN